MATESGYSNQKKLGLSQFKTVQHLGGGKHGTTNANKSLYEITAATPVTSVTEVVGASGQVEFWNIEITAHGAVVGNVLRFTSGVAKNWEFEILKVIDLNNFHVLPISDIPSAADTATIMGWITNRVSPSGESSVSISSAPTQYNYDGVDQTVIQDTTDDSKNRAMPSLNFTIKDGVQVPINEDNAFPINNTTLPSGMYIKKEGVDVPVSDSATPANVVAVPVKIMSVGGTDINITAGDINVNTTDIGVNFDSMRIGDGSGNYIGVTADDEAEVYDAKSKAVLDSIDLKTPALVAGKLPVDTGLVQGLTDTELRATAIATTATQLPSSLGQKVAGSSLSVVLATGTTLPVTVSGGATEAKQDSTISAIGLQAKLTDTQPVSVATLPLPTGAATQATLLAQNTLIGAVTETAPVTDIASSGLNGRLQRIAQNISSLIALLPTSLGAKNKASSLSVAFATDQAGLASPSVAGTITVATSTVGTTRVRATVSGSAPSASRKKLMIKPDKNNTGSIYLGGSTLTTANGMEIIGPDRLEFEFDSGDYYLISDTAGQKVEILEKV